MMTPKYPLARLSPAKSDLMVIAIARESVLACDTRPMLEKLAPLSATREAALRWEGTLTFAFDGWESDPRETAEIPEIRAYGRALTNAWPYWFHFGEKVGDTIPHVLRLLCSGTYIAIQNGLAAWRFEDMDELRREILRLFLGMNVLYERLDLPEANNARISQEIAQLLDSALQ